MVALSLDGLVIFFASRRDRKNPVRQAKNAFGVIIRAKIADIPACHIERFYEETKPLIKSAVYDLLHFLPVSKAHRLEMLWKDYHQQKHLQFEPLENDLGIENMTELRKREKKFYQSNDSKIRRYLDDFYKFSK